LGPGEVDCLARVWGRFYGLSLFIQDTCNLHLVCFEAGGEYFQRLTDGETIALLDLEHFPFLVVTQHSPYKGVVAPVN